MSDQYLKMCRLATEIQKAWKPKRWDEYAPTLDPTVVIVNIQKKPMDYTQNKIWFPQLEDLLEMLTLEGIKPYLTHDIAPGHNKLRAFYAWSTNQLTPFWDVSMDMTFAELLLWFVMHTLYGKSWNGEDWEMK